MELYQPHFAAVFVFCFLPQQYCDSSSTVGHMDLTHSFHGGIFFCSMNYSTLTFSNWWIIRLCPIFCYNMLLDFKTFLKIYLFFILFIYFWLRWVFVAVRGLSLVVVSWGYSALQCTGFPLSWVLLLQSTGSRRMGFSSCGTWAQ